MPLVLETNRRSHLELGQSTRSHVSSSTGCHPKCWLWTTPSPTVFAIRIRIAWQMAGWKTKNNNFSISESELWRNAGPSAFQLLKSDKIWHAYLVANCVSLRTFWMPLVLCKVKVSQTDRRSKARLKYQVLHRIPHNTGFLRQCVLLRGTSTLMNFWSVASL